MVILDRNVYHTVLDGFDRLLVLSWNEARISATTSTCGGLPSAYLSNWEAKKQSRASTKSNSHVPNLKVLDAGNSDQLAAENFSFKI